ncbi:MAG TPA: sigma 54-interacting transcriptional regulator, partial [Spirochaetales bacterium]|nr:sigma 54-interacting transcriptional regulator [Spirochaetales bacterium]
MSDSPSFDAADPVHTAILDSLPLGVYLCDTSGRVLYMNPVYAQHLGTTPQAVVGRNIVEFIPDTRAITVMRSGVRELGDLCMIGKGPQRKTLVVNRIPMHGADGQVTGMISLCLFNSPEDLKALATKIDQLDKKVTFYRRRMQSALSARYNLDSIQGESPAIVQARTRLINYAKTDFPVLIQGATGTGKELFANALHTLSSRKDGSFVSINCAAVPLELFESELFGYAAGAFSGSSKEGKVGLIELADKGTLFLDEVGDLPLAAQVKLLRVLEEKAVYRVGSTQPHDVDFRLVAA